MLCIAILPIKIKTEMLYNKIISDMKNFYGIYTYRYNQLRIIHIIKLCGGVLNFSLYLENVVEEFDVVEVEN